jgi:1-acyl-sn-glycerol-3-phosphate acyltransferase
MAWGMTSESPSRPNRFGRGRPRHSLSGDVWRGLSWLWLKSVGWKIGSDWPAEVPKAVIIAAPHTSNWDALHMIAAAGWYRVKLSWMGKASLVKGPLGFVVRWAGVVPVDRSQSKDLVAQMKEAFDASETLWLAVAPEATRDANPNWKSGFWHIARGANVPMIAAILDYKDRTLRLAGPWPTGSDYVSDLKKIVEVYRGAEGRFKEKFVLPSTD